MVDIQATAIDDFVQETLKDLGRNQIVQIAQKQTAYELWDIMFKKDRVSFDDGNGIRRTLMNKLPGNTQFVGLYHVDSVAVPKLLTELSINWVQVTTNWAYELREMQRNKGKSRINNIIVPRREGAIIELIEEVNDACWALPDVTDTLKPYGIPYWIVYNSTTGFNGGIPTGHTSLAGLTSSTLPSTFKNYTFNYTTFSKADLIKKMRTAHRKTKWRSPVNVKAFRTFEGQKCRLYMNETTISNLEDIGESQNENLGRDLATMDDKMVFKRHPLVYAPTLDTNMPTGVTNGIYAINHSTFFPVIQSSDWMRETGPIMSPNQHNVREVHYDSSFNMICVNRRMNWVASQ